MNLDKTLTLVGAKPKRVRFRVVRSALEQTTWTAKGEAKVTKKSFADAYTAQREFDKAVRKKLRDDYAVVNPDARPGEVLLEAFAAGGGGGAVLDMSLDGTRIVTATMTREQNFGVKLEVVEVATGARHVVLEEPPGRTQSFLHVALFDREATSLYFVLREDTYRLDIASGKRTLIAKGQDPELNPFVVRPSFDAERRRLVIYARGPVVRVLDDRDRTLLEVSTKSPTTECRGGAISPSGRLLAVYIVSRGIIYSHDDAKHDTTNEIQIWDIEAGVKFETVAVDRKLSSIGFTPQDDLLLVTSEYYEGPVALEIPAGTERWKLTDPDSPRQLARTRAWAYSHDGTRLAVAGNTLQLLDATTREPALELPSTFGRAECPVFSRDGRRLAAWIDGSAIVHAI